MLFNQGEKCLHLGRQVALPLATAQRLLPTRQRLIDALHTSERLGIIGKRINRAAVDHVARAHLDFVEIVEHVKFRERDVRQRIDSHRMAQHHEVEPTRATASPSHGAELAADINDPVGYVSVHLGGERSGTDSSGVRLGDADDTRDVAWADAASCTRTTGGGVRRRHVRIRAVVDIEEGRLRALEQN